MKPLIGLTPQWDTLNGRLWMRPNYMDAVAAAGGVPVLLPLTTDQASVERLLSRLDGVLFTGGLDLDPALYGEEPLPGLIDFSPERDAPELLLLEKALAAGTPVFGICRGIQLINAALGGTLYQDLPEQHPTGVRHRQEPPFDRPAHTVTVLRDTPLYVLLQKETLAVNSCHHQAVKAPAPGLTVCAVSEDGVIEALCRRGGPFLAAVQWHPEYTFATDAASSRIFGAFVSAAARR